MKKVLLTVLIASFVILPALSMALPAQAALDLWGDDGANKTKIQTALGYETTTEQDPRIIAANIIQVLLTFLGIIAVALIIYGGFKWMTAAGNDEKVEDARKIITAAVIGLIIILAAWALTSWALSTIQTDILESAS